MSPGPDPASSAATAAIPSPADEPVSEASTPAAAAGSAAAAVATPTAATPTSAATIAAVKREADGPLAVDDALAHKKKKTGLGSRGVANLTPEQLAKKRANDREAQRAIRERTKNQIETLERRIQELTNQQPYQELQAVLRAKEAMEQENADIKRRLMGIMSMLQPLVGPSAVEQSYISPAQTYVPALHTAGNPGVHGNGHAPSTPGHGSSPASLEPNSTQAHFQQYQQHWQQHQHLIQQQQQQQQQQQHQQHHVPPREGSVSRSTASPETRAATQLTQQRHGLRHGLEMGPERLGLDFLLDSDQRVTRIQSGVNGAQDTPQYRHLPMQHDWTSASHEQVTQRLRKQSWGSQGRPDVPYQQLRQQQGSDYHGSGSVAASSPGTGSVHSPAQAQNVQGSLPDYARPLKNCASTCPLDSILHDFLSERRQRTADGLPVQEVIGPRYPSVSSLLNPSNSVYSHPLSKVFTDILSTFPDISTLPERIAVLYIMFLVMRWQIEPTQDNHDRLPEWVRPLPSQYTTPHPCWVDYVPYPQMRERFVRSHGSGKYEFENFFIPYTTTISLSWPYEETDALLRNPDSDELLINPVFERHLRNLDNWKLGDAFHKSFPDLIDTYNLDSRSRRS